MDGTRRVRCGGEFGGEGPRGKEREREKARKDEKGGEVTKVRQPTTRTSDVVNEELLEGLLFQLLGHLLDLFILKFGLPALCRGGLFYYFNIHSLLNERVFAVKKYGTELFELLFTERLQTVL